jgi:hypothetical protein
MESYSEVFAGLALSLIGVYLVILFISALIDAYNNREFEYKDTRNVEAPDSNGVLRNRDSRTGRFVKRVNY